MKPPHLRASRVLLQEKADFLYVDAWSSNCSWGGAPPPEEGSLVVITKGQTVLLDQNTPILKMLLIQGKFLKIGILLYLIEPKLIITNTHSCIVFLCGV